MTLWNDDRCAVTRSGSFWIAWLVVAGLFGCQVVPLSNPGRPAARWLIGNAATLHSGYLQPQQPGNPATPRPPQPRATPAPSRATATFAGGCFWCMQPAFEHLKGVITVKAGYTGGRVDKPTYEEVSAGYTGHRESVEVIYDPKQISYQQLLDVYWHNVDPLDNSGQFCDKGGQYRSAIFVHDAEQKRLAEASKQAVGVKFHHDVFTDIIPAGPFYPAEDYHQDYYKKNPLRYKFYRFNCGRDQRLEALWGAAPAH